MTENKDEQVIEGFGDEWSRFDQSQMSREEAERMFEHYFNIFPWEKLASAPVGFDVGCSIGRWTKQVAPRVGRLHLIDASAAALAVAKNNLRNAGNCEFHLASVESIPLPDESCDFGYSLGVLHHIPDTVAGLKACVAKLKLGAPFLLYLYYRFDNCPAWFRAVCKASDIVRQFVSRMPHSLRFGASQIFAGAVYYPAGANGVFAGKNRHQYRKRRKNSAVAVPA